MTFYLAFYASYAAIGLVVGRLAERWRHRVHRLEGRAQWYLFNAWGWPVVLFALYRLWLREVHRRMSKRPPKWYDRLFFW